MNSVRVKVVADYTRMSFAQIQELDVFTFWALLRDAVIYNNSQTEKGRKWLHNAWRLTQTEPEIDKLRRKYGKEE